jgi:pimeloyl-ACP methyl ester carboxylesterase
MLFALKFSPAADTDGLAYKALELAESIRAVCKLTGAERVRLVAHSAGGLVARVYLQDALPGRPYRGDVSRLITIGCPHLGSSVASHWGDFLGTRATSLKPEAALVRNINHRFELPDDTTFVSIVVKGVAADGRGEGDELGGLVDRSFLKRLPVEYREGGDQVVHVQSQNLRLASCAARYEQRTKRPIQYIVARVRDPSPKDLSPREARVHGEATWSLSVQRFVRLFLRDDRFWDHQRRSDWDTLQARVHAWGAIEKAVLDEHPMSELRELKLTDLQFVEQRGNMLACTFRGQAYSANQVLRFRQRWSQARGSIKLTFDEFGRVVGAQTNVAQIEDL